MCVGADRLDLSWLSSFPAQWCWGLWNAGYCAGQWVLWCGGDCMGWWELLVLLVVSKAPSYSGWGSSCVRWRPHGVLPGLPDALNL